MIDGVTIKEIISTGRLPQLPGVYRLHVIPVTSWDAGYEPISKIQEVVYYQRWVLIGWATTTLYVIAN